MNSFKNKTNSFFSTLVIHTEALIRAYKHLPENQSGLRLAQSLLVAIEAFDVAKYNELSKLLLEKIDSSSDES